jgi:hypothetical protein
VDASVSDDGREKIMDTSLRKGNIILLKRLLADHICVVACVEGATVRYRRVDQSPETLDATVEIGGVIKLAEEMERMMPRDFVAAVDKQRSFIFRPKREATTSSRKVSAKRALEEMFAKGDKLTIDKIMALFGDEGEKEVEG